MKTLIVEDDYITAQVMLEIIRTFGDADIAENGADAIEKYIEAFENGEKYDAIFLDIMMPEQDGQEVLVNIREFESSVGIRGLDGVKIIMTTALDDFENIKTAFKNQCEDYIIKPFDRNKVFLTLQKLELV